jgi:hypothetical protein
LFYTNIIVEKSDFQISRVMTRNDSFSLVFRVLEMVFSRINGAFATGFSIQFDLSQTMPNFFLCKKGANFEVEHGFFEIECSFFEIEQGFFEIEYIFFEVEYGFFEIEHVFFEIIRSNFEIEYGFFEIMRSE